MSALGFPAAALDFYDGLEETNTREFWLANKTAYDRSVKEPMSTPRRPALNSRSS
ncbi:MAG: DUF2461 domain-containing protein [Actinobacteria bacterium]|nr:DUF2461 domain-containing protein [Actinomycetota bacterium]